MRAEHRDEGFGARLGGDPGVALLVALVAFALRLPWLDASALHIDELHSIVYARQSLGDLYDLQRDTDVHPPFFFTVVKAWSWLFGEGRVESRLLAAVLGAGAAGVFYLVARKLTDGRTALLAAAMFILIAPLLHYSRFVRMYPLVALLCLLAVLAYLSMRKTPRDLLNPFGRELWLAIGGGAALALAFLSHYTAVFYFFCLASFAAVQLLRGRIGDFAAMTAMLAAGTILSTPAVIHLLTAVQDPALGWMPQMSLGVFYQMTTGAYPFHWALKPLMVLGYALGLVALWRRNPDAALLVGAVTALGPLFLAAVSLIQPVYLVRSLVAYTLLAPLALAALAMALRPWAGAAVAALAVAAHVHAAIGVYQTEREVMIFDRAAPMLAEVDPERDRIFGFFRLQLSVEYAGGTFWSAASLLRHGIETEFPQIEEAATCLSAAEPCRSVVILAEVDPLYQQEAGRAWIAFLDDLAARHGAALDYAAGRHRILVLSQDPAWSRFDFTDG